MSLQTINRLDSLLFPFYVIGLFLAAIPLGSNRDWAWPFLVATFAFLSIYLIVTRANSGRFLIRFSSRLTLFAFCLLVLWIGFQSYGIPFLVEPLTIDRFSSQSDMLKTIAYACVCLTTIGFVTTRERTSIVIYAIVFAGLLQSITGIYGTLLGYSKLASGTFPNSNHFAGYLEMAIALGIGMMIATQSPTAKTSKMRLKSFLETVTGPRGRLRLVLIIMVIGLVMSTSRMGNIAFLSSLLITSALSVFIGRKINMATLIFLGSVILIDALIIGNYFGIERIANRIQNFEQHRDIISRAEINEFSLQMIEDHPFVGVGAGTYAFNFSRYRQQIVDVRVTNAENDYFEFLVELGIIGSIPLLLIVVIGLSTQLRMMRVQNLQFEKGVAFGCLMGTVSLLIHSAADFNLQIPSNAVLFLVLLSLPLAIREYSKDVSLGDSSLSLE